MKSNLNIRSELGEILFILEQAESVSLAIEDGLRNNSGGEFVPAVFLVTSLLKEQIDKIEEIIKSIQN